MLQHSCYCTASGQARVETKALSVAQCKMKKNLIYVRMRFKKGHLQPCQGRVCPRICSHQHPLPQQCHTRLGIVQSQQQPQNPVWVDDSLHGLVEKCLESGYKKWRVKSPKVGPNVGTWLWDPMAVRRVWHRQKCPGALWRCTETLKSEQCIRQDWMALQTEDKKRVQEGAAFWHDAGSYRFKL